MCVCGQPFPPMDGSGKEKLACATTKPPEGDLVSLARALQAGLAVASSAKATDGSGQAQS